MSKLFSCFWNSKKRSSYSEGRRLSRGKNEVVYVEKGVFGDTNNVRQVYRTETNPQIPQMYISDTNRQSRSYPVSPERRSVNRVCSFEQRPASVVGEQIQIPGDSRNIRVYAAGVAPPVMPRLGKLGEGSFEGLLPPAKHKSKKSHRGQEVENPRCVAEKPAEDVRLSRTLENEDLYLPGDNTGPKIRAVVRAKPQSSKNTRSSLVKPMVYRADEVDRPNIFKSPPPLLETSDGKILKPIAPDNVKSPSMVSKAPIRLSITRPSEGMDRISIVRPSEGMDRVSIVRTSEGMDSFPLAQGGGETLVACPMIGGGRGAMAMRGKPQKTQSILRKGPVMGMGRGGPPGPGRGRGRPPPQYMDEYDDYDYEGDYGPQYYDDSYSMDDGYSYGPRGGGGYYDDGYDYDDGYGRGPPPPRGGGRMGRQQHAVYAAKLPEMTLPTAAVDKGKNPSFKKTGKPSAVQDVEDSVSEQMDNSEQITKDPSSKVKLVSSAQQTDFGERTNELDFICFSPDKCFRTSEVPDDPSNSKLRWRIIIKRGDEE